MFVFHFKILLFLNAISVIRIIKTFPVLNITTTLTQKDSIFNLSKCFMIINETSLLKRESFYLNNISKKICLKKAISLGYKEDIYFPKYLHKCFPLCNSCFSFSKKIYEMNCISCLKGFKFKNGNCYLNKKYKENIRNKELFILFNTLNLNENIKENNIKIKYLNGETYFFNENNNIKKRKLYINDDDYDDFLNNIINRESQLSLTNDKTKCEYNFHINLSPYYLLAQICISQGKFYIENNRCVNYCTPQLETYFNYPVVEIKVGPDDKVTVCDCSFRCCKKKINNLSKSLDRGYIDGSYQYFRRQDGFCLYYKEGNYYDRNRKDTYLLAQDFVPCFFPIYNDNNEIEFYISGYEKTIVGNNCKSKCPIDDANQFYFYNTINSGCYKCPENCVECNDIPTKENGHCIKCKEGYNGIYKGFCYELCPLNFGERDGICYECSDNEIYLEGKCFEDLGESYNYGTQDNPSFKDKNNPKLYHKCVEFIGNKTCVISNENDICFNVGCPEHYYNGLNGYCYKCPEGCDYCNLQEDQLKCSVCNENYSREGFLCSINSCDFFISDNGKSKCYKKCPFDYVYLDKENGEKSYECIPSCQSEQYNYFNTLTNKCKARCLGDDSSVIEEEILCLEKCDDNYPENIDGVCENCAARKEFNNNGTCVIKEDNFDEIYFILSGEENEKYGRVGSCYIIDERGDYHPEHIKSREYNSSLCPNDCPSNFQLKYDENGEIFCVKCYNTCENCEHTGVAGNHKCIKCKNGYEFSKRLYGVCDEICNDGQYFYYEKNREKKCSDSCPEDIPFSYENENENNLECINNCLEINQFLINNTFTCVKECPEGFNIYNNTCTKECPKEFGIFGDSNECKECTKNNLYYYKGKCYNPQKELPLNTFIKDEDDGLIHECYENIFGGIKTGYYNIIQNCSRICPEEYFYDKNKKYCVKCPNCKYCDQIEGCKEECPDNYFIFINDLEEKCLSYCPNEYNIINNINNRSICSKECNEGEIKILYFADENLGIYNYKCIKSKCKDNNLFYYSLTNSCYSLENIPDDTYFNPDNQNDDENILSPCLAKVSDNEYITGFFYSISNCGIQCPENFYYAGNNICKKCHPYCKTCFDEGTNLENNCLSCIDTINRILNPYLFNCEEKCNGSFYYSKETKKLICEEECPKNNYIDEETGKCITNCNKLIDDKYCVNECNDDKIEFNGYCLSNVNIPSNNIVIPSENDISSISVISSIVNIELYKNK